MVNNKENRCLSKGLKVRSPSPSLMFVCVFKRLSGEQQVEVMINAPPFLPSWSDILWGEGSTRTGSGAKYFLVNLERKVSICSRCVGQEFVKVVFRPKKIRFPVKLDVEDTDSNTCCRPLWFCHTWTLTSIFFCRWRANYSLLWHQTLMHKQPNASLGFRGATNINLQ